MNISCVKPRSVTCLSRSAIVVAIMLMLLSPAAKVVAAPNDSVTHEMIKVTPYEFNGDVRNLPQHTQKAPFQKQPYVQQTRSPEQPVQQLSGAAMSPRKAMRL